MRKFIMAGVSAIAFATIPLAAQAQDTAVTAEATVAAPGPIAGTVTLSAEQQAQYESWSPELKSFYGTLDPKKQEAFWMLNAEQRMQLYGLTDGQKAQAWTSILAQVEAAKNGQPNPATAAAPAQPAEPAPGAGESAEPATPAP